jgi:outer membrane protein OmpA-like peptidoglycan-associated protein
MRRIARLGLLIPAALLVTGCATKDWVQEYMSKKEARIDERLTRVEGRVGEEVGRVDSRMSAETRRLEARAGTLETATGEANEAARQARMRAEAAHGRADGVDSRLTRLWTGRHTRNLVETIHVQFAFDRAELSDGAQTALLSIIKELKENPQLSVDLQGFTDSTGKRDYNYALSQRRVEAVRRYLIQNGAEISRIYWVGLGPLGPSERPEEQSKQRRVTVKLLVNSE